MLKFIVRKNIVVVDTSVAMIEEFSGILKEFPEDEGNKMLLYIYFCCDLEEQNPMRSLDYRLKEGQALSRVFGKGYKFTEKELSYINAGIHAYNFFNETSLERSSQSFDRKIDEISTLLDKMVPASSPITHAETGEITGYATNEKVIAGFSKQLGELATYKLKARETAHKIINTGKVRGGGKSSIIESGSLMEDKL